MDSGLKEGEQGFNRPSTPNAIVALVCARGGNMPADCSQSPLIGRWAGKRVLIQGDYAEDDANFGVSDRRFRFKPAGGFGGNPQGRFGPKRPPVADGFWSRLWRTAAA